MRKHLTLVLLCTALGYGPTAAAQEDSKFSLNGHVKLQGGVFVPLFSDLFQEHENEAYKQIRIGGGNIKSVLVFLKQPLL